MFIFAHYFAYHYQLYVPSSLSVYYFISLFQFYGATLKTECDIYLYKYKYVQCTFIDTHHKYICIWYQSFIFLLLFSISLSLYHLIVYSRLFNALLRKTHFSSAVAVCVQSAHLILKWFSSFSFLPLWIWITQSFLVVIVLTYLHRTFMSLTIFKWNNS